MNMNMSNLERCDEYDSGEATEHKLIAMCLIVDNYVDEDKC